MCEICRNNWMMVSKMTFIRLITGVSHCQNCDTSANWMEFIEKNEPHPDRELYRLCEECILLLDLQERLAE